MLSINWDRKIHISEAMMKKRRPSRKIRSCAFTAEFLSPFSVPCEILTANSWPRVLHCLDKILQSESWLQELIRIDVEPVHFHCARIPW